MSKFYIIFIISLFHFRAGNAFTFLLPKPVPRDSVGVEKLNGKTVVLHKVDSRETLFSIARKYKASVEEIKTQNPGVEGGLKLGQVIKVPLKMQSGKDVGEKKPQRFHIVTPGQGLYNIAKLYGVKADEIKKWNNLPNNDISVGQKLIVFADGTVTAKKDQSYKKQEPVLSIPTTRADSVSNELASNSGYQKIHEKGFAEIIEDDKGIKKHLCLHRTAPNGTIIQVKNETNGSTILVRVIGKLPETGPNEKLVIRISKEAFDKLGAINKRFPVEISYLAP